MLKRFYLSDIEEHLNRFNQMVFISGPRQVGKTTLAKLIGKRNGVFLYLNWDILDDKALILSGPKKVVEKLPKDVAFSKKPLLILDEIHKYEGWKTYVKGLFDLYKDDISIIVTGSARLDLYKAGGDSLMGRYFHYRIHPLSVGELCHQGEKRSTLIQKPSPIDDQSWNNLMTFGGFPDPFVESDETFSTRWKLLKHQQLFQEDIRELSRVMELAQMEVLAKTLEGDASQVINYSKLSTKIRVSDKTVRQWIEVLKSLYYCFTIKPWAENVLRSLTREPKCYLWDWSSLKDPGARVENFVACHLLKATHYWTDIGLGAYTLHYVRDSYKKEVDFLIAKDNVPWMLVEVKSSYNQSLSKNLVYFHETLKTQHAFQVAYDLPFQEVDAFELKTPKIISLRSFLSELP
jgi:predicted AAA+ superfamily ATPase